MKDRFGHVGRDTGDACIELVPDQYPAAGAGMRCPPPNPILSVLDKIGNYQGLQLPPSPQGKAECRHGQSFSRTVMFWVWLVKPREVTGSHAPVFPHCDFVRAAQSGWWLSLAAPVRIRIS
jgi:hypothetical protein